MPLSPDKIIYTKIGKKNLKTKMQFNEKTSIFIKRIIAEHAYRYIYSKEKIKYMRLIRPRIEDLEKFNLEKKAWEDWHKNQSNVN